LFTQRLVTLDSNRAFNEEMASRFSRWLVALNYSKCALDKYPRTVRRFSAFLQPTRLLKVTHFDVQEFLARSAASGQAPKLIREQLYALRIFFDFLNLGGLIKWVPPRMVKMRPMQRHIPKVLTQDQLHRVLGAACTKHERALVELFYGTGCRTGELRTMRIENVDFDHRRIRVTGKAGTRVLMFTSTAARALRTYVGDRRSGFVFVEQKPPQKVRPQRTPKGEWHCRWKVYDDAGSCVLTKSGFICARKAMNYRQAVAHFSALAKMTDCFGPLASVRWAIPPFRRLFTESGCEWESD
jgi:integrase